MHPTRIFFLVRRESEALLNVLTHVTLSYDSASQALKETSWTM